MRRALADAGIEGEVTGRPKHIYSIINKMKRKQIEFGELYDVRAVRILVNDVETCYAALSVVHELWPSIASEFDDYIANPKSNGYRSLHTAVTGPRNLALEVQIRTHDMHHDSELGVAAHWRYKENKQSETGFDEKISWLRQILAWKAELADSGSLQEQFKNELLQDRVYVLTPQGKVIDLPKGATPVDFAYSPAHRPRPPHARRQGGWRHRAAQVQTAERRSAWKFSPPNRARPSRDWLSAAAGLPEKPACARQGAPLVQDAEPG